MFKPAIVLISCYFIGSVPWSAIVAKVFSGASIDLSREGTRNVGATNVWYLTGPIAGCIAAGGDACKGILAVFLGRWAGLPGFMWPLCGWMAVVGHSWSVFLKFRGGRGASATVGAFVALMPWEALACGLMVATGLLTFGGCLLLSLAAVWPFCLVFALARGAVDFKTACTATFLVLWVLALGWKNLHSDFIALSEAMSKHLVRRKLYRFSALIFPALIYPAFGYGIFRSVLLVSAGAAFAVEYLRFHVPKVNEFVKRFFAPVGRPREAEHISSTTTFLLGSALASLFPEPIGAISMVVLILGDAWASLCGTKFGRTPLIGGKTLEGSLGCFVISCLSCFLMSKLFNYPISIFQSLTAALAATVVEALSPSGLDNLTMAPVAALVLCIMR